MAFRRKDIKKASYYVWFLGAKESEGLRGEEFVIPVLRYFLDREGQLEPSKVTLQVSNKGLKIIQNVPKKGHKILNDSNLITKMEQIKHLIPHHAITCVIQEEDIVCCILLIYNPITKCPVHVHAYRCDSIETATSLRLQLQILIDRPENQRKFREIEKRLASKGLVTINYVNEIPSTKFPSFQVNSGSDGRSTRTESSDQTEDSLDSSNSGKEFKANNSNNSSEKLVPQDTKAAMLFESLAAELKAKLSNPKSGPILLPPRDYDTISRKQGKLNGIENRKSTNAQIVRPAMVDRTPSSSKQQKVPNKPHSESSGKSSSGIGSDEIIPLSPDTVRIYQDKYQDLSSEEERNWSPIEREKTWKESDESFKQCQVPPPIVPKTCSKNINKPKFSSSSSKLSANKLETSNIEPLLKEIHKFGARRTEEVSKTEPFKADVPKFEDFKFELAKAELPKVKKETPPQPKRYYFPDSNFVETERSKLSPIKSVNPNQKRPLKNGLNSNKTHSGNHPQCLVRISHWPSPITY